MFLHRKLFPEETLLVASDFFYNNITEKLCTLFVFIFYYIELFFLNSLSLSAMSKHEKHLFKTKADGLPSTLLGYFSCFYAGSL